METDLEGVSGVERFNQTYSDEPFRFAAMRQLTWEVNACIQGILDAHPDAEIDVFDGHGPGGLLPDALDKRAQYWRGWDRVKPVFMSLSRYDACMFIGQHAMSGTVNAPLCHTMSSKGIVYYRLNGVYIGEFGFWAAIAGYQGVPVIFLSGDDKAVVEAQGLVPQISAVVTKWGEGWQKARHVPVDTVLSQIRSTVCTACQSISHVAPVKFDPPYTWEVRHVHPRNIEPTLKSNVLIEPIDERTILYRSDDILQFLNVL